MSGLYKYAHSVLWEGSGEFKDLVRWEGRPDSTGCSVARRGFPTFQCVAFKVGRRVLLGSLPFGRRSRHVVDRVYDLLMHFETFARIFLMHLKTFSCILFEFLMHRNHNNCLAVEP